MRARKLVRDVLVEVAIFVLGTALIGFVASSL